MRPCLLALVLLSGCSSYSADHFVVVDVSDNVMHLTAYDWDGVTRIHPGDAIRSGIHFWDSVGCKYILPDEVPNALGQHLEIVEAADAEDSIVGGGDAMAWFDSTDGKIKVNAHRLDVTQMGANDWALTWAHEIGHALGLGHISGHAVMNPSEFGMSALQKPDVDEFDHVFGR